MRKWLILLTALVLLFPSPAQAQTPVALDALNVLLWSEYDQPSMLVIYNFTLTDDTQVPTTMDIRFPRDANITAVAFNNGGELILANYQNKPEQDSNWQVITLFVTERTDYHIEYYQPFGRDGDERSFTYQWTGDYSVNDFNIEVQVPDDSRDIKTNPAIPLTQNQPFMSGGARMSGLAEGQDYQIQLEYSRSSEATVVTPSSPQVVPIEPVDENTAGRSTLDNLPLFLGGFGVILILVALTYFLRGQTIISNTTSRPRRRSRGGPQEPGMPNYCPECGTRSHAGDRFCRTCGGKLRGS